jgi:hypothetical protein
VWEYSTQTVQYSYFELVRQQQHLRINNITEIFLFKVGLGLYRHLVGVLVARGVTVPSFCAGWEGFGLNYLFDLISALFDFFRLLVYYIRQLFGFLDQHFFFCINSLSATGIRFLYGHVAHLTVSFRFAGLDWILAPLVSVFAAFFNNTLTGKTICPLGLKACQLDHGLSPAAI